NHGGTRELGARLGSLGYRTAIVLAAAEGLLTSDDRVAGFSEGFTSAGGSAPTILRDALTRDSGYNLMTAALQVGIAPGTVVFGASDVVAFGAMSAVRDAGREVGDDIAIAGFGDIETGRDIVPSLTTVRAPLEQLGRAAVEATIADDWTEQGPLPVEVIVRDSTPAR
ncbi:MAG: substrate-binding domain-containing protein, partial [Candidatus Microbacterium stercoravium]